MENHISDIWILRKEAPQYFGIFLPCILENVTPTLDTLPLRFS
jgi:hypothetical protein